MMKHLSGGSRWLVSGLLLAGLLTVIATGVALAQSATPAATQLAVQSGPGRDPGQLLLQASLTAEDGKPVSEQAVTFYLDREFMGRPQVYLGQAKTDANGHAVLAYQATQTGDLPFRARFEGDDRLAPSEATWQVPVTDVVAAAEPAPAPLANLGHWLGRIVGLLTIAFWALLLGLLFRTGEGIYAAGRLSTQQRRPETRPEASPQKAR